MKILSFQGLLHDLIMRVICLHIQHQCFLRTELSFFLQMAHLHILQILIIFEVTHLILGQMMERFPLLQRQSLLRSIPLEMLR